MVYHFLVKELFWVRSAMQIAASLDRVYRNSSLHQVCSQDMVQNVVNTDVDVVAYDVADSADVRLPCVDWTT